MDTRTKNALRKILDYLSDEKKDYESLEPAERKNHIYVQIKKVEKWLND